MRSTISIRKCLLGAAAAFTLGACNATDTPPTKAGQMNTQTDIKAATDLSGNTVLLF